MALHKAGEAGEALVPLRPLDTWEQGTDMARHRKVSPDAEWRVHQRRWLGQGSGEKTKGRGRDAQKAE